MSDSATLLQKSLFLILEVKLALILDYRQFLDDKQFDGLDFSSVGWLGRSDLWDPIIPKQ